MVGNPRRLQTKKRKDPCALPGTKKEAEKVAFSVPLYLGVRWLQSHVIFKMLSEPGSHTLPLNAI